MYFLHVRINESLTEPHGNIINSTSETRKKNKTNKPAGKPTGKAEPNGRLKKNICVIFKILPIKTK